MVLLDEVQMLLPQVRVHGFLDSPYFVDIPSFAANFTGFQQQSADVLANFNAWSVVSESCYQWYGHEEAWKCLFGQYRMPFLRTPFLVIASQFDSWQLSHLVHGYSGIQTHPNLTRPELGYTEKFAARTQAGLTNLKQSMPKGSYIYSSACYNHHISEKRSFFTSATSSGLTESEALEAIWTHNGEGFNCGRGCDRREEIII
ncbi:notum2 [Symbiodinium pilosum]|uniref:Notum2 protein n=1 Tax=Symbiodinium pilosum TaxID=2952 RepID=A0A812PFT8_SYMPI|nr:notum2 [Symbiodinium pilosum]